MFIQNYLNNLETKLFMSDLISELSDLTRISASPSDISGGNKLTSISIKLSPSSNLAKLELLSIWSTIILCNLNILHIYQLHPLSIFLLLRQYYLNKYSFYLNDMYYYF